MLQAVYNISADFTNQNFKINCRDHIFGIMQQANGLTVAAGYKFFLRKFSIRQQIHYNTAAFYK